MEYAKSQGSTHAERYYTSLSRLADKAVGIEKGSRNNATIKQLTRLSLVEEIIKQCIESGISQEMPYKDIYKACKQRMDDFQAFSELRKE